VAWFLQGPVDDCEVSRHDEIVPDAKTMTPRASADSANDTVPVEETVWVPQDLLNGKEFKGIELGIDYKSVLALAKAIN
jgi:hypothetical protein